MERLPSRDEIRALPADGGAEFNRLVHEVSPYLLQHARNPVDWYPWGPEAFAKAEVENKPIFLSVGYSTCHWCHVMERESFEVDAIAAVLNRTCVPVKVDREERPDVDEIYMTATQLLTGHGGWPNSVWLLPDGRPWYAGTYFPPQDQGQRMGFVTMLERLDEFWRTRRNEVEQSAQQLTQRMSELSQGRPARGKVTLGRDFIERTLVELRSAFDPQDGGFGSAPKFPPHGSLALLLYEIAAGRDEEGELLGWVRATLDAMAQGGIHDQVGGGFHRYSTDGEWLLPHFEKMLYDNAQLATAYCEAYRLTGDLEYRRVVEGIHTWVAREMCDAGGGFHSALDADSEGEEGKCYVWTHQEIMDLLGEEDGELFARVYRIEPAGNYRDEATRARTGTNIPHLRKRVEEHADATISASELAQRLERSRAILLEARQRRVPPHLDDKVLTSWNALYITSLAQSARVLEQPEYLEAARRAASFLWDTMFENGRLHATYREGEARLAAYLDDYAYAAEAYLELFTTTGETTFLDRATRLADVLLESFWNPTGGGFYFVADDHEDLILRTQDPYDRAIPSGNGVAVRVLQRLAQETGGDRYRSAAQGTLTRFAASMRSAPRGTESLHLALAHWSDEADLATTLGASTDAQSGSGAPDWGDARVTLPEVEVCAFVERLRLTPGSTCEVAVLLRPAPEWKVTAESPETGADPDWFLVGDAPLTLSAPKLTEPGEPVGERAILMRGEVRVGDAAPGPLTLGIRVRVQPCTEGRCAAPAELALDVPLLIATGEAEPQRRYPRWFATPK